VKKPPKPRAKILAARPTAVVAAPAPIVFSVNVILPEREGATLATSNPSDRFLAAGKPSPWHDISEVPEMLKPFVGEPPEWTPHHSWEQEQEFIEETFGPVNESVRQALEDKQTEMIQAAEGRNRIDTEIANRADRFVAELREENDAEVRDLYESKQRKSI
jgi:hypothetical protein